MIYREIALPEPLRRIALCAWQFIVEDGDPPAFQHMVPPDGTTGLVLIRLPDGKQRPVIVGPTVAAFTVPVIRGCAYAGLRLRPEMAGLVLVDPPSLGAQAGADLDGAFSAVWQDLAALMGGSSEWHATTECLAMVEDGDGAIAGAIDRLMASGGTVAITTLAMLTGLSQRQFRRRFHAATGITPKQFADVQRVRHALILALDDPDWAGVAHDSGFADQPHLIRDVKQRFGAAPLRVSGYFGGMRHELLDFPNGRILQADATEAA